MNVEFMVICDYVVVTPDQKQTMVGTFDRIMAPQVPMTLPQLGVGARLRDAAAKAGKAHYDLELRIKAPDGSMLGQVTGAVDVQFPGVPEGGIVIPIGLMFNGLVFPKYGVYQVELWIDKQRAHSLPIYVSQPVVNGHAPAGGRGAQAPLGIQAGPGVRAIIPRGSGGTS